MNDLISRQAAIDAVIEITYDQTALHHGWVDPYYVVNRLEYLPTAEPSATLMKVKVGVDKEGLRKAMEEAELTLVAEPRKGKWERHYSRPNVYADLFWHCSECGYKNDENYAPVYHHFCPNCGARMEES